MSYINIIIKISQFEKISMKLQCPICKKVIKSQPGEKGTYFPFCSQRCKLVDLNAWFDGNYTISRPIEKEEEEGQKNSME
ncbi:MAG: zinc-binding protein [Planctomycetes bacterium ADurb.Bin401]|nr:MAG: zinc-binding protein [Planctomycetes bacterium ADurb.Bin401]